MKILLDEKLIIETNEISHIFEKVIEEDISDFATKLVNKEFPKIKTQTVIVMKNGDILITITPLKELWKIISKI